jgi:hypothetical protein
VNHFSITEYFVKKKFKKCLFFNLVIGADTGVAKLGVGVVYGECLGVWTIMR